MTMAWVALGVGVAGAAASYAGAKKQAKGAEKAGELNMQMFDTLNRQQQPFIQGGYGAMGRLNTLLGLNPRPTPAASSPQGPTGIWGAIAQQVLAQNGGSGGSSPGYMPTPGGGVQPIMQTGNPTTGMNQANPFGIPGNAPNMRLHRILALRAANGDTQAANVLNRMA